MSNKPNLKQRSRPARVANRAPTEKSAWWQSPFVWVGALIVVAFAIAVGLSVGGDESSRNEEGFAEIIGTALPRLEGVDVAIGAPVPAISAQDFDGQRVQIGVGGPARLYGFFAHWCPHCQAELPRLTSWLSENDLPPGVTIVAISTNVEQSAPNYPPSDWFEREAYPLPVVVDNDANAIADGFGLSGFPFWVAADADGRVLARVSGELTVAQFEELVAIAAG